MRTFGLTADGHVVHAATLTWPGGVEIEVLNYGAIVHRLAFPTPSGLRPAILAYDRLEDYERDTAYLGALVGRVANRVGGGRFALDGREAQLSVNEPPNTLHGGKIGFNKRMWRFEDVAADGRSLSLAYRSPDGEEGFPGMVDVRAAFSLVEADTLQIDYWAEAEAATPINLSQHLYFNLSGVPGGTILHHTLQVEADGYTPVGQGLIPTGVVSPVAESAFDLRQGRLVGEILNRGLAEFAMADGLDFNWALDRSAEIALTLRAPDGATLDIRTDQAGMQVYSGQYLKHPFVRNGALAIEPQGFPDAVNHPAFPDTILHPGQTYRRTSRYRLRAS